MSEFTTATHIRSLLQSSRQSAANAKAWLTIDPVSALAAAWNAATDAEEAVTCIKQRMDEREGRQKVYACRMGSRNYPRMILARRTREELEQDVAGEVHGRIRCTTIAAVAEASTSIRDGELPRGW